jgi:hypothetical protein
MTADLNQVRSSTPRRPPGRRPGARRQRGVALITTAAVCSLIIATYSASLFLRNQAKGHADVISNEKALNTADAAIVMYAQRLGYLPCAAVSPGGAPKCSADVNGWLPFVALKLATDQIEPEKPFVKQSEKELQYVVLNGDTNAGGADLTEKSSATFVPRGIKGEPADYDPITDTTYNVCARVTNALVKKNAEVDFAFAMNSVEPGQILHVSPSLTNPSQKDLPPEGPSLKQRGKTFEQLYSELGCTEVLASLNGIAVAHELAANAQSTLEGNKTFAETVIKVKSISVTTNSLSLARSSEGIINGIWNITDNLLKAAEASTNPALVVFVPKHMAAVGTAGIAIAWSTVNILSDTVGLAVASWGLKNYQELLHRTETQKVWHGGISVLREAHAQGFAP